MINYRLLTVDLWDTILRRRCYPDETKLLGARYIFLNHYSQLKEDFKDVFAIFSKRQEVERNLGIIKVQEKFDDEYFIEDVYVELLKNILTQDDKVNYRELSKNLTQKEVQFESFITYIDSDINMLLSNYSNVKKVVLSDFYIDSNGLNTILRANNCNINIDKIIVSCETGYNKRSGRAFKHVEDLYNVPASAHLHIGDNQYSDKEVPEKLGITSILHSSPLEMFKNNKLKSAFENRKNKILTDYFLEINKELDKINPKESLSNVEKQFFLLGVKYSAFFVLFGYYLLEESTKNKSATVYFFTREGEFFKRIFDTILGLNNDFSLTSELLEVSRLATFAPSISKIDLEEMMKLWNLYSVQSLRAFFKSLNTDVESYSDILNQYSLNDYDTKIEYPWLDERVKALFSDNSFIKKLYDHCESKKNELKKYFIQKKINSNSSKVMICDIGWRGTIQDNIAEVFPKTVFNGYYFALNNFLNRQPSNCIKSSFGPNLNGDLINNDFAQTVLNNVSVLEMLCNSSKGSVIGYKISGNKTNVIKEENLDENIVNDKYIKFFQDGVVQSIKVYSDIIKQHNLLSTELREESIKNLSELINNPPYILAKAYKELKHNEVFGTGNFTDKSKKLNMLHFILARYFKKYKNKIDTFMVETGWSNWKKGFEAYYRIDKLKNVLKKTN